ncbi:MAG: short-chain dehydrogenase/reductase [Parachlamydiales bacterium]|nr:short-chain dehydrogenase/reductase [Parachlamydiales bacterium]
MKGIIVSATSDIATEMCLHWKKRGWDLSGTYFSELENYKILKKNNIPLYYCNLSDSASVDTAARQLAENVPSWDFLLFATGSQIPVGAFEKVDIDRWVSSIQLNFVNQLRLLHRLLPVRNFSSCEKSVLFFAGGGTNNSVNNYSAYTLSKIALIKACELFDSEIKDVKFSIVGPGWVKTKIHNATLESGEQWAEKNFEKTRQKLNSNDCVPIIDVIRSFEWILSQPKKIVGGRNFSTVFDQWGSEELVKLLSVDGNMYKLRRFKNDILVKS